VKWKIVTASLLLAGSVAAAVAVASNSTARSRAVEVIQTIRSSTRPSAARVEEPSPPPKPRVPWNGELELDHAQAEALGVTQAVVEPQTKPIRLEINGTTAHDPSTITQIRTRFSSLVKKVDVAIGETVHKGDPLVELYSVELAEAKSVYEQRMTQWTHDEKQLARHQKLYDQKAISEQVYLDTVNDEQKSRLEYKLARDKLSVYGLTDEEIHRVDNEQGDQLASLILRSPTDGLIIGRNVVQDNLYDISTVLISIAPLNHLWVKGFVYESDQHRVAVGQVWDIEFPFIPDKVLHSKIEYIDARVDPTTKTVQIRTSIPNPGDRLKADMLVRGTVMIPPHKGRTVIPRNAMVVTDADSHVFVRVGRSPDRYVRREIEVAKEYHDRVIVQSGLEPGEVVAARGSLLLSQMYEDRNMSETGNPL
jgi:cobalt-zinc-cadmium efflux system membrane fusion protein